MPIVWHRLHLQERSCSRTSTLRSRRRQGLSCLRVRSFRVLVLLIMNDNGHHHHHKHRYRRSSSFSPKEQNRQHFFAAPHHSFPKFMFRVHRGGSFRDEGRWPSVKTPAMWWTPQMPFAVGVFTKLPKVGFDPESRVTCCLAPRVWVFLNAHQVFLWHRSVHLMRWASRKLKRRAESPWNAWVSWLFCWYLEGQNRSKCVKMLAEAQPNCYVLLSKVEASWTCTWFIGQCLAIWILSVSIWFASPLNSSSACDDSCLCHWAKNAAKDKTNLSTYIYDINIRSICVSVYIIYTFVTYACMYVCAHCILFR